jgi:histidyl-tRNA synthetase
MARKKAVKVEEGEKVEITKEAVAETVDSALPAEPVSAPTPTPARASKRASAVSNTPKTAKTTPDASPKRQLETSSYKGVRDFYPKEMFLEKYIFDKMRRTAESFGYIEYGASILEPAELYKAKTGEEIVNEQTYTFTDRGGREVTLRPEMTPTIARMIAAKHRELSFPLRWFSIPNLFRYEQPQRGRLREHYQLNVDIFGLKSERADIEIVSLAYQLLKNLGATDEDFEIQVSDRKLLNYFWDSIALPPAKRVKISKIIDKKGKISKEAFEAAIEAEAGKKAQTIINALDSGRAFMDAIKADGNDEAGEAAVKNLISIIDGLSKLKVTNVVFTPTLVRGLDYYSGFVFEIFDKNTENSRSLFGGGRYDNLLEIFNAEPVPAVGFGAGDVTIADFMRTHNLLPEFKSPTHMYIAVMDEQYDFADIVAEKFRDEGMAVIVDYSEKGVGDRIKKALADNIPFFTIIGKTEFEKRAVKIKDLDARTEKTFQINESGIAQIAKFVIDTLIKKAK